MLTRCTQQNSGAVSCLPRKPNTAAAWALCKCWVFLVFLLTGSRRAEQGRKAVPSPREPRGLTRWLLGLEGK